MHCMQAMQPKKVRLKHNLNNISEGLVSTVLGSEFQMPCLAYKVLVYIETADHMI